MRLRSSLAKIKQTLWKACFPTTHPRSLVGVASGPSPAARAELSCPRIFPSFLQSSARWCGRHQPKPQQPQILTTRTIEPNTRLVIGMRATRVERLRSRASLGPSARFTSIIKLGPRDRTHCRICDFWNRFKFDLVAGSPEYRAMILRPAILRGRGP
jgi:hypothetical protein